MRIALIPSSFWPSIGGVEDLTRQLATELARTDEIEIWTSAASSTDRPATEQLEGLTIRRFELLLPSSRPVTLVRFPLAAWRTMAQMERAFDEFRPELLHVVCFAPNGAYATALSRRRGVPLIITLQGETVMDDHDIYDRSAMLRMALRRGIRQAAAVTACSRFTLEDAVRFGASVTTGEVIFNGTNPEEVTPTPLETPFDRYVLCLGRVVEKKGFDLMMRAFAQFAPSYPDVGFVIAGSGAMLSTLEQLARELGIDDRVLFTGPLGRAAVAGAMRGAAVFVMPSRLEPFGIVALEGWRGGAPIVVSARGGAPEFVQDGIDGLVVDPFDTDALAHAVERILSDRAFADEISRRGTERLAEFTWTKIAERYRDRYQSALAI